MNTASGSEPTPRRKAWVIASPTHVRRSRTATTVSPKKRVFATTERSPSSVAEPMPSTTWPAGPDARFAGLRTFTMLGLLGGGAGLLAAEGLAPLALGFVLGGVSLAVAAYVMAARRSTAGIDGTTEAAALTVLLLATLAGMG